MRSTARSRLKKVIGFNCEVSGHVQEQQRMDARYKALSHKSRPDISFPNFQTVSMNSEACEALLRYAESHPPRRTPVQGPEHSSSYRYCQGLDHATEGHFWV